MGIISSTKRLISKKTFQDLSIVSVENVLSKGLYFILIIAIARTLGPEKYGLYSFITVSILTIAMFLDFGMENTAICFSGKYLEKREIIFGAYLLFRTAVLVVLFFIFLMFPDIMGVLLNSAEARKYSLIILVGCIVETCQFLITTYLQSLERFFIRAIINTGVYATRLICILTLLKWSIFDIRTFSIFFALSGIPFMLCFINYFIVFLKRLYIHKLPRELLKQMFHYAKWIFLGSIGMNIFTRLDFYIVTYKLSFREAGIYNSAFQLLAPLTVGSLVFGKVFMPKLSNYASIEKLKIYIAKVVKVGCFVSILMLLILPFSRNIISFFFGAKYLEAAMIFRILTISSIFTLWNVMFGIAFYSSGRAKYMAIGAYIQLAIFLIFVFFFLPRNGMAGVAWSRVFSDAAYLGAEIYFLIKFVYLEPKRKDNCQ